MFNCFLSIIVQVSDAYVNILSIVVFFILNFSFFDMFLFLKYFCSIKNVLVAFFILSCKSIWSLLSSLSITREYLNFSLFQIFYFQMSHFKLFFLCTIIYIVFSWFICSLNFLAMFSISTNPVILNTMQTSQFTFQNKNSSKS